LKTASQATIGSGSVRPSTKRGPQDSHVINIPNQTMIKSSAGCFPTESPKRELKNTGFNGTSIQPRLR
jgi:hypothetical protein